MKSLRAEEIMTQAGGQTTRAETRVCCCPDELTAVRSRWSELAVDSPMSSPDWLLPWWQAFGAAKDGDRQLHCITVHDDSGRLIGLAPWYRMKSHFGTHILRFLGDGAVCSDHQSILAAPQQRLEVCESVADRLRASRGDWDALDLEGVDADDPMMIVFARAMEQSSGCYVRKLPQLGTWALDLPRDLDTLIDGLSKNRRKRMRKWQRTYFDSGRAVYRVAVAEDLPWFYEQLRRLHAARRQELGDPGIFADPRTLAFHQAALAQLLAAGRLHLSLLEIDGKPAAAEYILRDRAAFYAYQSGIDPAAMQHSPGSLALLMMLRAAIDAGAKKFDFLRGDEEYKLRWGAKERPAIRLQIRKPGLRGRLGDWGSGARQRLKQLKHRLRSKPAAAPQSED